MQMCRVSPLHVVICDVKTPYQLFSACTLEHREPLLLRAYSSLGSRDERHEQQQGIWAESDRRAPRPVARLASWRDAKVNFVRPASTCDTPLI